MKDLDQSLEVKIGMILCPEGWDRDAFRRVVKATGDGRTVDVDIEASMMQCRSAAISKAVLVLNTIHSHYKASGDNAVLIRGEV